MPTRGRTRNPFSTPSPIFTSNVERAVSRDWHKVKAPVDTGFNGQTLINPPYTVPNTPPPSSSQESIPSLSTTPSSNEHSLIQTPETASEAVARKRLCFPEKVSPNLEGCLGETGNQKSLCWTSNPVLEPTIISNELDLKIEQFLIHPEASNKNTWDSLFEGVDTRESYPIVSDNHVIQKIARQSTPEHQIIRPYCAPAETKSWHSPSQDLCRQKRSASPVRHYRSSLPSVFTAGTTITVPQRCTKRQENGGNTDWHLQGNQRESYVSKEAVLALRPSEKPSIAAWILGCAARFDKDSISRESESTYNDVSKKFRLTECNEYIVPLAQQPNAEDFIKLTRKHLCHLPNDIVTPLLASLRGLFKSKIYELIAVQSATTITSSSGSFESSQNETAPASSRPISNRKKRTSRDDDDDMPDTDDEDRRKKQKLNEESKTKDSRKWACPFYQKKPHRYCVKTEFGDFRKCARSPGFPDVHRVKNHIKECHSPKYCDRCLTHFKKNDDLETHRRSVPVCDLKDPQSLEGLSTKQQEKLGPRDRKPGKSEEDRWNTIYKICFPEDPEPLSPYYVHYTQEVAEIRRAVLEIIQWETRLPNEINPNRLRQRVDDVFASRMSANNPTTVIAQTPLLLTPSSHNSSDSTGFSSQAQARDTLFTSPSVKHCSKRVALVTGSGNTITLSPQKLLKPIDLPQPSNDNQACSSEHSRPVNDAPIPILHFNDALHLEENQFDMTQLNSTIHQPDLTTFDLLFDDYEGFDMSLGYDTANLFESSQDNR